MYVKFPKNRWKEIERAEKNNEEGNRIFKELKQEYLEKYMPKPDADPHGGIEDFDKLNDPNICVPGGEEKLQSTETSYYKDEMH